MHLQTSTFAPLAMHPGPCALLPALPQPTAGASAAWRQCPAPAAVPCPDLCLHPPSQHPLAAAHRWRKRGLAAVPTKFGISFTTKFLNQAGALVHIYTGGLGLRFHLACSFWIACERPWAQARSAAGRCYRGIAACRWHAPCLGFSLGSPQLCCVRFATVTATVAATVPATRFAAATAAGTVLGAQRGCKVPAQATMPCSCCLPVQTARCW